MIAIIGRKGAVVLIAAGALTSLCLLVGNTNGITRAVSPEDKALFATQITTVQASYASTQQTGNFEIKPTADAEDSTGVKNTVSEMPPTLISALESGQNFRECPNCPEMMVVPAGEFEMGTSSDEISQSGAQLYQTAQEQPAHHVSIKSFAIGKYSITLGEFNNFLSDVKINATGCRVYVRDHLAFSSDKSGRDPGFAQTDRHPVVCVSWDDAQNYISWLNGKIRGQTSTPNGADGPYRLPTEAEMEYATRAGTKSAWFWGYVPADQCDFANGSDLAAKEDDPDLKTATNCLDGYPTTAPVGSLRPNPWNLYDMVGNVFQWTSDCWHFDYNHAPSDGRSWQSGDCSSHILRGGGWTSPRLALRSASRIVHRYDERNSLTGFRIVRSL